MEIRNKEIERKMNAFECGILWLMWYKAIFNLLALDWARPIGKPASLNLTIYKASVQQNFNRAQVGSNDKLQVEKRLQRSLGN